MPVMKMHIPETIARLHQQEKDESLQDSLKHGLVIWEYINGRLSLRECGEILSTGYRGFLELLWSKGLPIDALNEMELEQQLTLLRTTFNKV